MTYKEKLAEIRPDLVGEQHFGGVYLCPPTYFDIDIPFCERNSDKEDAEKACRDCWNQEYKGEDILP